MTMEASTPARAATARIVVCSYPRAANVARAAPRMARRVPADRGPPVPGTGADESLTGSPYRAPARDANACLQTLVDIWGTRGYVDANSRWQTGRTSGRGKAGRSRTQVSGQVPA